MKNLLFVLALPLFVTWSSIFAAETCYTVEGNVKTLNVSGSTQVGSIEILLLDEHDNEAFRNSGDLIGTITGADTYGRIVLSHTAIFNDGSAFVTSGDLAAITGIRKFSEDGLPCSYLVDEWISNMTGSGVFENVISVDIQADGYISACIVDGENENEFELSGTLCIN